MERQHGFPAHAGMDPKYIRCASGHTADRWGFPAHAGMDPMSAGLPAGTSVRASPHTRGWTRFGDGFDRLMRRTRGDGPSSTWRLPAHAGMDPGMDPGGGSGDVREASPHTRGWTHRADQPAGPRSRWLPRTRGDGPASANASLRRPGLVGFPAHAGMDPDLRPRQRGGTVDGLPRTRGDGPVDVSAR